MRDYYDYDIDEVLDELPLAKEAYEEYERDRDEINDDEEYYRVCEREYGCYF